MRQEDKPYEGLRHVRGTRVYAKDAIYHLRTSTVRHLALFADDVCKPIVLAALKQAAAALDIALMAYVIMPDHVHVVVRPCGAHNISEFMASFKKHSARKLNKHLGRKGPLWRREFFDHMLRSQEHLEELVDYIHHNPVRRGLVPSAEEWEFSSWHEIHGKQASALD